MKRQVGVRFGFVRLPTLALTSRWGERPRTADERCALCRADSVVRTECLIDAVDVRVEEARAARARRAYAERIAVVDTGGVGAVLVAEISAHTVDGRRTAAEDREEDCNHGAPPHHPPPVPVVDDADPLTLEDVTPVVVPVAPELDVLDPEPAPELELPEPVLKAPVVEKPPVDELPPPPPAPRQPSRVSQNPVSRASL